MPDIIESTYRIKKSLGSGGGGNVYLAEHLRMKTEVVLKADKRKITTPNELLRREVDILKELHHTYIPKVHDFFVENDTVYTVMDYVNGESLDKPLERGECFSQKQIVKWAIQLLEALVYLHNPEEGVRDRGYVHGDIKPANIMRKPNNDICLIDFNIALAIGEENVIGFSAGYSSPEHYGLDYSEVIVGETRPANSDANNISETKTILPSDKADKKIVPDARSDIYSLGATLYHLLSGKRPSKNALDVDALSVAEYNPQIARIIAKAMNPNPNLRYQSAEDMLYDFLHLREKDERTIKYKKIRRLSLLTLSISLMLGISITFVGLKRIQVVESWLKLSEYSASSLDDGDVNRAIDFALQALPEKKSLFMPTYIPEAQKALSDSLRVYDLSEGFKKHKVIELPSNPLYLKISPTGKTAACICSGKTVVFSTENAQILYTLDTDKSALSEVEFIGDDVVAYASEKGLTVFDLSTGQELWHSASCTAISVSQDNSTIATIYKGESVANIYDAKTGKVKSIVDFNGKTQSVTVNDTFANPNDNVFELNSDGTLLGVSFKDGSLEVFDLMNEKNTIELFDESSSYTHFEGGFYNQYFAFSASNKSKSVFAVIDTLSKEQTGGFDSNSYFSVVTDKNGVYVQMDNLLVQIDPVTGEQKPLVTTSENLLKYSIDVNHTAIASKKNLIFFDDSANKISEIKLGEPVDFIQLSNGLAVAGSMNSPKIKILKYQSNSEGDVFKYESKYDHDEVRISADNNAVMLFNYKQINLFAANGELIKNIEISEPQKVFDQQYRRSEEDSWLEVIYNDGTLLCYDANNGELMSETKREKPDLSLKEVFYTDRFRIESPLHGLPIVYNKESNKKICEIRQEGYLTYVYQVDKYIIAQFVTTDNYHYGVLMNEACEALADLPYLCDVKDGELYFDYPSGNVRKSRIFNIDELIKLAHDELAGGNLE